MRSILSRACFVSFAATHCVDFRYTGAFLSQNAKCACSVRLAQRSRAGIEPDAVCQQGRHACIANYNCQGRHAHESALRFLRCSATLRRLQLPRCVSIPNVRDIRLVVHVQFVSHNARRGHSEFSHGFNLRLILSADSTDW